MQSSRIKVSSIRPYQSVSLGINSHLSKKRKILQHAKEFSGQDWSKIYGLFRLIIKRNAQCVILIVNMEMWKVMRRTDLPKHSNDDAKEAAQFGHDSILRPSERSRQNVFVDLDVGRQVLTAIARFWLNAPNLHALFKVAA